MKIQSRNVAGSSHNIEMLSAKIFPEWTGATHIEMLIRIPLTPEEGKDYAAASKAIWDIFNNMKIQNEKM